MALKPKQFEDTDTSADTSTKPAPYTVEAAAAGTTTVGAATVETPAPAAAPAPDPAVAATTTIAQAATGTSVGAVNDAAQKAKAFKKEVEAMKNASDFSYGNYSVFKGNNGDIVETDGDKAKLGRWAKVRLLAWRESFQISPGDKGKNTKEFVAYSTDGITIDSVIGEDQRQWIGKPCKDYVQHLKDVEGFDGAKTRRFIDTACALLASDSGRGPIGTSIQVTLSESSIPAFRKYQSQLNDQARCVEMGLPGFKLPDDPFTFFFLRELAEKGDNNWTKLRIVSTLPAEI